MENASKALIMAGGILTALLVIGALMLMFNQLGSYQRSNSNAEKNSQIAAFNREFEKYAESDVKGTDIISLANKIIDYNKKDGTSNSIDYDKKITLYITLGTKFADKYGVNKQLKVFDAKTKYEIKNKNNDFYTAISKFRTLEERYTLETMNVLSANYDTISSGSKTIKDIVGKNINISVNEIEQYREYSEFKTSTFKSDGDPEYEDGQIVGLSFIFEK